MYFEVAVLVALISCAPAIKAQQGLSSNDLLIQCICVCHTQ